MVLQPLVSLAMHPFIGLPKSLQHKSQEVKILHQNINTYGIFLDSANIH